MIKALISLIFVIVFQLLEGNLIPQSNLSSLATVVMIFEGWSMAGVLGTIVAIPMYAGIRVVVIKEVLPAIRRQTGAEATDLEENVT
ncbi:MAG: hypothetical protein R6U51_09490 [Anaerolineales bacterium]